MPDIVAYCVRHANEQNGNTPVGLYASRGHAYCRPLPYFRELITADEAKKRGIVLEGQSRNPVLYRLSLLGLWIFGFFTVVIWAVIIEGDAQPQAPVFGSLAAALAYLCYRGWKKHKPQ